MAKKTGSSTAQQDTPKLPNEPEQKMPAEPQAAGERTRSARTFRPRVDIYETERGLMLLADMPGATSEGLTITLERRALHVHAQVQGHAPEGYSPIYEEFQIGDFECDFTLSGDFDADRIEASLQNGVLRLTVPRAAQAEARTIKISAGT